MRMPQTTRWQEICIQAVYNTYVHVIELRRCEVQSFLFEMAQAPCLQSSRVQRLSYTWLCVSLSA